MLGTNLIEPVPDQPMVIEIEASAEGDFWSGWQHDVCFSSPPGGDEIAAIDHSCGKGAMADLRAIARIPGRSAVSGEMIGALVAKQLHAVAPFDEREPLCNQSLQFDGSDFAAILLALAAALRLLVVIELAFDPLCGSMKQV